MSGVGRLVCGTGSAGASSSGSPQSNCSPESWSEPMASIHEAARASEAGSESSDSSSSVSSCHHAASSQSGSPSPASGSDFSSGLSPVASATGSCSVRRVPGIVRNRGVNVSLGGRVRRWRVLVFRFVTRRPVPLSPVPQGIPVIIRHGLHGRILPLLLHGCGLRVGLSERIERHSPMLCADTRSSCSPPSS